MTSCLVLQHVAFEDAGLLSDLLRARGFAIETLQAGVDPIDAARFAAAPLAVVLGGPIGVYETRAYPFLVEEIAAIRARLERDRPTLGVCLGAQLIAAALGAKVAPGPAREIGYAPVELTQEGRGSILAALDGAPVLHWHGDNLELPEGARRLAFTSACPNQAFTRGPNVLGLQFHLETPPQVVERWLIGHAVELAKAGIDPCAIRADALRLGAQTAAAGRNVFGRWLDAIAPNMEQ